MTQGEILMSCWMTRWVALVPVLLMTGCTGPGPVEMSVLILIIATIVYVCCIPFLAIGHFLKRFTRLPSWLIPLACLVAFGFIMFLVRSGDPEFIPILAYPVALLLTALPVGRFSETFKKAKKTQLLAIIVLAIICLIDLVSGYSIQLIRYLKYHG